MCFGLFVFPQLSALQLKDARDVDKLTDVEAAEVFNEHVFGQ